MEMVNGCGRIIIGIVDVEFRGFYNKIGCVDYYMNKRIWSMISRINSSGKFW